MRMSTPDETTEKREKELENRIQMLEQHLERLAAHIGDEGAAPAAAAPVPKPRQIVTDYPDEEMPELTEEVLGWASRNAVLPRLATVCFLMVIALVLRTITDSGLVNKLLGSGLGMGYAAALMAFGWFKYGKESRWPRYSPPAASCSCRRSWWKRTHTSNRCRWYRPTSR